MGKLFAYTISYHYWMGIHRFSFQASNLSPAVAAATSVRLTSGRRAPFKKWLQTNIWVSFSIIIQRMSRDDISTVFGDVVTGGFPNDLRPVKIKLERVSLNI